MGHRWYRLLVLGCMIGLLINCTAKQPPLVQSPPSPTPIPSHTPSVLPEVKQLLNEPIEPYCEVWNQDHLDTACNMALAVKIADYISRYPNNPHELALWRRIMELSFIPPNKEISYAPNRTFVAWAFAPWVEAEARFINLSTDFISESIILDRKPPLTLRPVNLDGDRKQDYLATIEMTGTSEPTTLVAWMRWNQGTWQSSYLTTLTWPSMSNITNRDLNSDGQEDVMIHHFRCGSACSEYLEIKTWRDEAWHSLLPGYANQGSWQIDRTSDPIRLISEDLTFVEYIFDGTTISPARIVSTTQDYQLTAHSFRLGHAYLLLGQYDQAIATFDAIAKQPAEQIDIGSLYERIDLRPIAIFRVAVGHLLAGDQASAQRTWQQLINTFPELEISKIAQKLDLPHFSGSITTLCSILDVENPNFFKEVTEHYKRSLFNLFDWTSLCTPSFLVPNQSWSQTKTITGQMQDVGLPWQQLSAGYDLNNDGINDILGFVDYLGAFTPWAMLSDNNHYLPLRVTQPWGLATPLARITEHDYDMDRYESAEIVDLDANGVPEMLLKIATPPSVIIAAWRADHFELSARSFGLSFADFRIVKRISIEPQPDGTSQLVGFLDFPANIPYDTYEERYKFENYSLNALNPINRYTADKSIVYSALFFDHEPQKALELLDLLDMMWVDSPLSKHELLVMRALALEHAGRPEEAHQFWQQVATSEEATGWQVLARER